MSENNAKGFYDFNKVSVNGNIARVNAFYTKNHTKGAYVTLASEAGNDKNGQPRTNWIEFQAWGKQAQAVADTYRKVQKAPKGNKKVSVEASIRTYLDSRKHNHQNLVVSSIRLSSQRKALIAKARKEQQKNAGVTKIDGLNGKKVNISNDDLPF